VQDLFHWMTWLSLQRIWEGLDRPAKASCFYCPNSYQSFRFLYVESLKTVICLWVSYIRLSIQVKTCQVPPWNSYGSDASFPNSIWSWRQKTREKLSFKMPLSPWRKCYISPKLAGKRKAHMKTEVKLDFKKRAVWINLCRKTHLKATNSLNGWKQNIGFRFWSSFGPNMLFPYSKHPQGLEDCGNLDEF